MLNNKGYYPTPDKIIVELCHGLKKGKVLEPSAGKGSILIYLLDNHYRYDKDSLYCIEKDPELRHILKGKGFNLIDIDFLRYESDIIFDYIIMNPPFSDGHKHLLKAWEISNGAEIRCLLNAETINNPYSKSRELLKSIIDKNGTVKDLGQCFVDSERKTSVNVVMVTLKDKAYESKFKFNCNDYDAKVKFEDISKNDIARKDVFQNMEVRFNKVKDLAKTLVRTIDEMAHYGNDLIHYQDINNIISKCKNFHGESLYNDIITEVKSQAWKTLINKTNIEKYTTSKVRKDFQKVCQDNENLAFTKNNMETILKDIFFNQDKIIQDCIEESFDLMTKYYKENRCHIEGWKSNDQWQVNRKVILPNMMDGWSSTVSLRWDARTKLNDIEKALCFITNKNIDNIESINESLKRSPIFGKWIDSEYFEFKVFKKATMHMKFKDEDLWNNFNLRACQAKRWLKGV